MSQRHDRMPGGVLIPTIGTPATLDLARSDVAQAGPVPGAAVAGPGVRYRIENTGGQGEDLEILALRSGPPGAMGVGYRLSGETEDADWRGWNPPVWLSSVTVIGSGVLSSEDSCVVTLPASQEVIVAATAMTGNGRLRVFVPGSGQLDPTRLQNLAAANYPGWAHIAACLMPDETAIGGARVLVLFGGTMHHTVDAGETWEVYSDAPMGSEDISAFGRVRMAYYRGEILLLTQDATDPTTLHQYASRDRGATFDLVGVFEDFGDDAQIVAGRTGFVVLYRAHGTEHPTVRRLPSAYTRIDHVPVASFAASAIGSRSIGLSADPVGDLWMMTSEPSHTSLWYSTNDGQSWTRSRGYPWRAGLTSPDRLQLRGLALTWAGGSLVCSHDWSSPATGARSCHAISVFGGWSNLTALPPVGTEGAAGWEYEDRMGSGGGLWRGQSLMGQIYVPALPLDDAGQGWELWETVPGVPVAPGTLTSDAFRLAPPGSLPSLYRAEHPRSTVVLTVLDFRVSGTGHSLTSCVLQLASATVADSWAARVSLTPSAVTLLDKDDGVVGAVSVTPGDRYQVMLSVDAAGRCSSAVRRVGETRWEILAAQHQLPGEGSGWSNGLTQIFVGPGGPVLDIYSVKRIYRPAGSAISPRFGVGSAAYGRVLTGESYPIPDAGSHATPWLRAASGLAIRGQTLLLPVAYEHGVERVLPQLHPSGAAYWRTPDGDTGVQQLVFDAGAAVDPGGAVGLYVGDANIQGASVWASHDGFSWVSVGSLDLRAHTGAATRLAGDEDTLYPAASETTEAPYWWADQMIGGSVRLGLGVGGVARRIIGQQAGAWVYDAAHHQAPRARLQIDLRGGEPVGAEILLEVRARSGLAVFYPAEPVRYRYWMVRIPSGVSPEGYWRIGTLALGPIRAFGQVADLARSDAWDPNVAETADSYGVSRVYELGPGRQTWALAWNDGQFHGDLRSGGLYDWIGAEGDQVLGGYQDVGYALRAIMRETESGAIPVVALESLPYSSRTLLDPTTFLYGRIRGGIQVNQMAGVMWGRDEWVRTEGITIEGIPGPLMRDLRRRTPGGS